jgi:FkbM family methyltransferase
MNGTDRMLVLPRWRGVREAYEPEVWRSLMGELRRGDTFVDVGAYIGLYTVAAAQRVGPEGRVIALEPNPENHSTIQAHVRLNGLETRVELVEAAAGARDEGVPFCLRGEVSHVGAREDDAETTVRCLRLDTVLRGRQVGVLKIDVEGYEEMVLRGAENLLGASAGGPRAIYVEVHPYAWPGIGTTSQSLLQLLARHGYVATGPNGEPVTRIERYGEIVARKRRT